eukprot:5528497-Pyramimonas_sp.AAC.1
MTGGVRLRLHSCLGLERGSDVSGGPPEPKIPPGSPDSPRWPTRWVNMAKEPRRGCEASPGYPWEAEIL